MTDSLKRQVLPGGLWVVATPIGNVADLAPRARRALEEADAILCEDTRRTSQLLSALGLGSKRLERLDAHSGPARIDEVVSRLVAGKNFALVSDAGTPAVSDPGSILVAKAREQEVRITPFPGASAVLTLLSVAGFNETAFVFRGFFPRKDSERASELTLALGAAGSGLARVLVWFDSPERISESLKAVALRLPSASVVAAKELTKLHERIFWGKSADTANAVDVEIEREGARGEWCFAVELQSNPDALVVGNDREASGGVDSSDWVKALQCLLNAQVSASGAAREVSQQFGVSRKRVYEVALRLSGKKTEEGG